MTVHEAKELIKLSDLSDDAIILKGKHGIGKSNIVRQFAEENGYYLEELFLSHQEIGDIIGIPKTIEKNGVSITTWSIPPWLYRMNNANKEGKKCILFLDEFNRGQQDVKDSALQLVLERKIHEHLLPEIDGHRTMVVAAINPADDNYQVDELDPALLDRFCIADVDVDVKEWVNWAKSNNINKIIIDYIIEHPDHLHWEPIEFNIGTSPRSWAKLSNYVNNANYFNDNIIMHSFIGKLGIEIGMLFYTYYKNYSSVIKLEDIEIIVEDNTSTTSSIDELALLVKEKIKSLESIQKMDLANQFSEKYKNINNLLPLLTYLYALPIEVCLSFLKSVKTDNNELYKKLVKFDVAINDKALFKRIVEASTKI